MDKIRVLATGGMHRSQSLWSVTKGFERAGCEVTYIPGQVSTPWGKQRVPTLYGDIVAYLQDPGADLLYWWQPQNGNGCEKSFIQWLEKEFPAVRLVGHSLDDPHTLESNVPQTVAVLGAFQYVITCCYSSFPWYRTRGAVPILGYPPCDRDLHGKATPDYKLVCDISFVGTNVYPTERYPETLACRTDMVKAIADLGTVYLYGHWDAKRQGWGGQWGLDESYRKLFRGWCVYDKDQPSIYASSCINLNSHVRPDGNKYLNERLILAMACGGFMLTDHVSGIETIFKPDKELVLWHDLDELREKATWWLAHEKQRAAVAAAGRAKVLKLFDNEALAKTVLRECVSK